MTDAAPNPFGDNRIRAACLPTHTTKEGKGGEGGGLFSRCLALRLLHGAYRVKPRGNIAWLGVRSTVQEVGFVRGIGVRMISGAAGLPGNRCISPRIDSLLHLVEIRDIWRSCEMV